MAEDTENKNISVRDSGRALASMVLGIVGIFDIFGFFIILFINVILLVFMFGILFVIPGYIGLPLGIIPYFKYVKAVAHCPVVVWRLPEL